MSTGNRQIGIVNNELRGNNCDGLDLANSLSADTTVSVGESADAESSVTEPSVTETSVPGLVMSPTATPKQRPVICRDMIWTHHWADQHDRCAHVGGRLVCRRCLVLYPVTIAVLVLARFGIQWPNALDTFLMFALPLPLVLDFVLEHMGFTRYSPRRQMATTFLGAIALGHALARYLEHNSDPLFWTMIACYAGLCAGSVAVHHLRDRQAAQQRMAELEAADPLVHGFTDRAEMLSYLNQSQTI
jgi:hypothetical protein